MTWINLVGFAACTLAGLRFRHLVRLERRRTAPRRQHAIVWWSS